MATSIKEGTIAGIRFEERKRSESRGKDAKEAKVLFITSRSI